MAFTGSAPNKTYQRTDGVRTGSAVNVTARANGSNDTAELADARENDMADALSTSWQINGDNQPSANLPMNDKKFTGLAAGTAANDSVRLSQIQASSLIYGEAGGTANAITITTTPTFTPIEGTMVVFIAEADNSGATTVNVNATSTLALQFGGAACTGGEVNNGQAHIIVNDGTQWQLVNPARLFDIEALAKTDGNIIVGNGTAWVAESGATARTSLGLGTGDSPQFTGVNIGDAADTTLTRASAGVVAVEGVNLLRATQNLADVSSAATAFANIKQAASDTATGAIEIATVAEMEAGTDNTRAVVPGRQHRHQSAAKLWGYVTVSGGTPVLSAGHNILTVNDGGVGNLGVVIDEDFSSVAYSIPASGNTADFGSVNTSVNLLSGTQTAASFQLLCQESDGDNSDPVAYHFSGFGDQA